jgi:hypothetical protein
LTWIRELPATRSGWPAGPEDEAFASRDPAVRLVTFAS